jgi:hypothetical protein
LLLRISGSAPAARRAPAEARVVTASTRPPGSPPLSDAEAARHVRRSPFEPRPRNFDANRRVATASELAAYRAENLNTTREMQRDKVTGHFTGTTDEIIQWAAWKWGFDEDLFRAVAAVESWWNQSFIGDSGMSPGLFQMKQDRSKRPTTYLLVRDSTAFNADAYGASMRYYYDGKANWLNDPCCYAGRTYKAGDLWGTIGAHFSGRWYDSAAQTYIAKVKADLARRVWAQSSF